RQDEPHLRIVLRRDAALRNAAHDRRAQQHAAGDPLRVRPRGGIRRDSSCHGERHTARAPVRKSALANPSTRPFLTWEIKPTPTAGELTLCDAECYKIVFHSAASSPPWHSFPGWVRGVAANLRFRRNQLDRCKKLFTN